MASTDNSLVMGVAAGYTAEMVLPFLLSLRETDYRGKVCLFIAGMSENARSEIAPFSDYLVPLESAHTGQEIARYHLARMVTGLARLRATRRWRRLYPGVFEAVCRLAPSRERLALRYDLEQCLEGFQSLRYIHYLEFLEQRAIGADLVMISDVRDVLFQRDPFAIPLDGDLAVFLEPELSTIGYEPFNRRWIRNLYGPSVLRELEHHTPTCSGTTMGTGTGMRRYLSAMVGELPRHNRPLGSHDQGIHNFLVRNGRLDPARIYGNGDGPVLTMSLGLKIPPMDPAGRLLNNDRLPVPVLHQYDRHPDLAPALMERFRSIPA